MKDLTHICTACPDYPRFNSKRERVYYKNSFFPFCVNEWNKLDPSIRNSTSISVFKKALLKFIRTAKRCPVCNIFDTTGLKSLTSHKFLHNFQDTLNPHLCSCINLETETTGQKFEALRISRTIN